MKNVAVALVIILLAVSLLYSGDEISRGQILLRPAPSEAPAPHVNLQKAPLANCENPNALTTSPDGAGKGVKALTLFFEDFEDGSIPTGWTIIDNNGDGEVWQVGTTDDLSSYEPPDFDSSYAFYSDDDAGSGAPPSNPDGLRTPEIDITGLPTLILTFSLGYNHFNDDSATVRVRFDGGTWINLATYHEDTALVETFDLTPYLPASTVEIEFDYWDNGGWNWALAVDNVTLKVESCDHVLSCGPYNLTGDWLGDMAYNPNTGFMYAVEVGGNNGILVWDPSSCDSVGYIDPGFTTSQRGIAYNPNTNVLYVGGWNEEVIYTVDPITGTILNSYPAPAELADIAGLAYDDKCNLLWIITNSNPDMLGAVDPATGEVMYGPTPVTWSVPGGYQGAGLAWAPPGYLLAMNQVYDLIEIMDKDGISHGTCFVGDYLIIGWGVGYVWGEESYWTTDPFTDLEFHKFELPPHTPINWTCDCSYIEACGPYNLSGDWLADMAYNPNIGVMYAVEVSGGNGILVWNPNTCDSITYLDPGFTTSQRGIAYNPDANVIYVGGWNEGIIYTVNPITGEIIESHPAPPELENIAGMAYDPECDLLWIITNDDPDKLGAVDPTSGELLYGPVAVSWTVPGSYQGAGLAWGPPGFLIAMNQGAQIAEILDKDGIPHGACYVGDDVTLGWSVGYVWGEETFWTTNVFYDMKFHLFSLPQFDPFTWECPQDVEEQDASSPVATFIDVRPNPSRGITEIAFNLPKKAEVELSVYNAAGMRVKTLVNGKVEAGIHKVTWKGTDARGTTVPQGVYFFRLETGNKSLSRKCILMR